MFFYCSKKKNEALSEIKINVSIESQKNVNEEKWNISKNKEKRQCFIELALKDNSVENISYYSDIIGNSTNISNNGIKIILFFIYFFYFLIISYYHLINLNYIYLNIDFYHVISFNIFIFHYFLKNHF